MMFILEDLVSGEIRLLSAETELDMKSLENTMITCLPNQSWLPNYLNSRGKSLGAGVHHFPAMEIS